MEKIKTIRLYRYNIGITEENDCTEYMTMDYFDSFDVEEEEDIISGCIGNGEKYSYLAMQEMCFKCDEIFRMPDGEKSFFTLIQIFVNPDFIYSDQEDEDDKVSYILKKYIDKFVAYVQEKCKVDYQVFPLITAGDYLVCIRSNDIHVAYDISTVLRDLYFEMGQKRCLLFTTYSILGMKNDIILTDEKLQQLHINEKDLVSIRGIFSDRYREADLEMNPSIDREEYQLYGRYDQTVGIPLHDYLQMQNFLVLYKKGKFNEAAECIECFMSKEYQDIKSKELLEKISKGYFSYWNERILLYKRDDFSEFRTNKEQFCVANLPQRKFLKQINTELYIECEELLRDIKEHQTMWERERINTYYNLLERLLEISKNLNYQRELRIHVAILLKQMKSFMSSMHKFRIYLGIQEHGLYEHYVIEGVRSLDIFANYIRNINLQTLQAPNYNLQINGSMEKILMAYDWFISHILEPAVDPVEEGRKVYYVTRKFCPVLIPQIGSKDQSVEALFEYSLYGKRENDTLGNLLVVAVPHIESMKEYESYLPILCHEVAHNIRYDNQNDRNRLVAAYILDNFSYNLIHSILSVECCELLEREKLREMQQLLKQEITDVLFPVSDMEYAGSLKTFEIILQEKLESFCGKGENTTEECLGVHELIKKTQENVLDFNERFAEIIQAMERETTVIKENLDKIYKGLCQGKMNSSDSEFSIAINDARKRLLILCKEYMCFVVKMQWDQIRNTDIEELICEDDLKMKKQLQDMFENNKANNCMRESLKAIHNCWWQYSDTVDKIKKWTVIELQEEYYYHTKKKNMCRVLFANLKKNLEQYKNLELEWKHGNTSRINMEQLKNKIGLLNKTENQFWAKFAEILLKYNRNDLNVMVARNVAIYREVASDLFMCGIFKLTLTGYLQLAVRNFRFDGGDTAVKFNLKRCKLVCQTIWYRNNPGSFDIEHMLVDAYKKYVEILMNNYRSILKKDQAIYKALKNTEISQNMIKGLVMELDNILQGKNEVDLDEKREKLYTEIYRFCSMLLFMGADLDCSNEKQIICDFASDISFFAEKNALKIRKYIFDKYEELCEIIAKKWNGEIEQKEKTEKEGKRLYTEFLLHCYKMCRRDIVKKQIIGEIVE